MKKTRPSEGIRRLYQVLNATFADSKTPLTVPQNALLRALLEQGPMYQTQITAMTGIDRSTLSEMLKRMLTQGFVVGARLEGDKRAVMVSLTPAGRSALKKAEDTLVRAEAAMLALVPAADRQAFLRGLRAVNGAE